jgi:hypothetical protein
MQTACLDLNLFGYITYDDIYIVRLAVIFNSWNVSCPTTFVLKIFCIRMVDLRTAGIGVAISHLVRSLLWPDVAGTLSVEINQFRAEIAKAEVTLTQTSAILQHCTNHSNFLIYTIKLLAFSEGLLILWVAFLLVSRYRPEFTFRQPSVQDLASEPSSPPSSTEEDISFTLPSSRPRSGRCRPSELRAQIVDRQ